MKKIYLGNPSKGIIDFCRKKYHVYNVCIVDDFDCGNGYSLVVKNIDGCEAVHVFDTKVYKQCLSENAVGLECVPENNLNPYITINGITYDGYCKFDILYEDMNIQDFYSQCLLEDTIIKLKDGYKKIQDVTYDDMLFTYDFDNGQNGYQKPIWIKKEQIIGNKYYKCIFESGRYLNVVIGHRVFSQQKNKFETLSKCIGDNILVSENKWDKLINIETIYVKPSDNKKFYNVITNHDFNMYTNDILTSCRLNNMYEFENLKFLKDGGEKHSYQEFEDYMSIDDFNNYRISEQNLTVQQIVEYVGRLNRTKIPTIM